MPDIIWILIVTTLMIIGIVGSVLPALPGTPIAFAGLLVYKLCPVGESLSWWWIALGAFLTTISLVTGYFIPVLTTKKFGGSKYGITGAALGIILGFFLPFGFIYGPFIGALAGELINDSVNHKKAIKASLGAFLGFFLSVGINMILCGILMSIFIIHLLLVYF